MEFEARTLKLTAVEFDALAPSETEAVTVNAPVELSVQVAIENVALPTSVQEPGRPDQRKTYGADPPATIAKNVTLDPVAAVLELARRLIDGSGFTTKSRVGDVTLMPFESFTTA